MSGLRPNCNVMREDPSELTDVISVTLPMGPNDRSSGATTVPAIVSGLAPGNEADTDTVGKSTCGNGDTGNNPNATAPAMMTPIVNNVVATGRKMNGEERFTASPPPTPCERAVLPANVARRAQRRPAG